MLPPIAVGKSRRGGTLKIIANPAAATAAATVGNRYKPAGVTLRLLKSWTPPRWMAMMIPKVILPIIKSAFMARIVPPMIKLFSQSSTALMSGMPGTIKSEQAMTGCSDNGEGLTRLVSQAIKVATKAAMAIAA